MAGFIVVLVLQLSALCLMAAAVAHNQIVPTMATALTVPIANLAGAVVAGIGLAVAVVFYRKNAESKRARRTLVFAIIVVASLLALLPLSELGMLSKLH